LVQVYARNLVAENSLVRQLAKLTDTPFLSSGDNFAIGVTAHGSEQLQQEPDGFEQSVDPTFENCPQCALIDGDYKGAVAQ
jgi:protein transport protein SEC31